MFSQKVFPKKFKKKIQKLSFSQDYWRNGVFDSLSTADSCITSWATSRLCYINTIQLTYVLQSPQGQL